MRRRAESTGIPMELAAQRVADPPDGADQALLPIAELGPERAHVHLDDVGVAVELEAPEVVEHLSAREDVSRAPREQLEQVELAPRQVDAPAVAVDLARGDVDCQVVVDE